MEGNIEFVQINDTKQHIKLFSTVFYLEQVEDQRASVTQVVNNLEVIDVTVH